MKWKWEFYKFCFEKCKKFNGRLLCQPPKINNLFTKFRKELLPDVMKNWENMPNDQQQSLGNVNEFFCGLHFLVGLADQAEAF